MADKTGFKHIQVHESDDDIVIVAGSGAFDVQQEIQTESYASTQSVASERQVSEASTPKPQSVQSADTYQETTLEDLERSRMPLTQKVVIAIAVAAIVVFAVWYAVVML